MASDVRDWLQEKIAASDPAELGAAGALRLAQSAAALIAGRGMAFGMVIADLDTRDLGEQVRETLQAWIGKGGRRRYDDLVDLLGSAAPLSNVGVEPPSQDPIVARVVLELAAIAPETVPDGTLVPGAWAGLRDSPGLDEHREWIVDARLIVRRRDDGAIGELTFLCRHKPPASAVEELCAGLADLGGGELFVEAVNDCVMIEFDDLISSSVDP